MVLVRRTDMAAVWRDSGQAARSEKGSGSEASAEVPDPLFAQRNGSGTISAHYAEIVPDPFGSLTSARKTNPSVSGRAWKASAAFQPVSSLPVACSTTSYSTPNTALPITLSLLVIP